MSQAPPETTTSDWVARFPIYYGWVILGAGTLGIIMTSPGQTFIVQAFIEEFMGDLGLSRTLVSTLYMIGTLANAALLQLMGVGRMIDRRGPRLMALIVSILFGLTCVFMGFVNSAVMLCLGFIALRFFGQGSLSLVSGTMINQWWVRRRGTMQGISGVAMSALALGVLPGLVKRLIHSLGWRTTYGILGAALILVMAPIGFFLFRRRPEDHGLLPDGRTTAQSDSTTVPEAGYTLAQAVRTPAFWTLSLGMATISMLSTGLVFHMESIVTDQGLTPAIAAAVFIPIGLTQALLRFPFGLLVDRICPRLIIAFGLVIQAVILWMATRLESTTAAYIYGATFGVMQVSWGTAGAVMWAKYYGREHLGSISSVAMSIAIVGTALGPMIMGVARDLTGSYGPLFNISAFLPLALAVVNVIVRPPRPSER
jgi:sugar phosphate permease